MESIQCDEICFIPKADDWCDLVSSQDNIMKCVNTDNEMFGFTVEMEDNCNKCVDFLLYCNINSVYLNASTSSNHNRSIQGKLMNIVKCQRMYGLLQTLQRQYLLRQEGRDWSMFQHLFVPTSVCSDTLEVRGRKLGQCHARFKAKNKSHLSELLHEMKTKM